MDSDFVRRQMVMQQIRTWDVTDPDVLEAFSGVPRDHFVPAAFADCAYADTEIPLPHGQCMLRPNIVGRVLQALDIQPDEKVLEVGTGTGYLTACLARVASSVTSIDLYADFVDGATSRLENLGVDNATVAQMDASQELPAESFDAIAVTASVYGDVDRFTAALSPGGRLFLVIGRGPAMTACRFTREEDGNVVSEELFETRIPALVTTQAVREFSF